MAEASGSPSGAVNATGFAPAAALLTSCPRFGLAAAASPTASRRRAFLVTALTPPSALRVPAAPTSIMSAAFSSSASPAASSTSRASRSITASSTRSALASEKAMLISVPCAGRSTFRERVPCAATSAASALLIARGAPIPAKKITVGRDERAAPYVS